MKRLLPLFGICLAAASCTTPYRSGQTPDDVYYAPQRATRDYVQTEEREQEPKVETQEDRYLRLRIRNRERWSVLDDYYRDPYSYTYSSCNCQCVANPRLSWNYYHSPYYYGYVPVRPVVPNRPRPVNFDAYQTPPSIPPAPVSNPKYGSGTSYSSTGNSTDNGSSRGSTLRNTYNDKPASSAPAPRSTPSSGSSAPRNAPVRRF